jgi:hypothetical protein
MLSNAGYKTGEVRDAGSFTYKTTLIVYADEAKKPVAEEIQRRLGYGEVTAANGEYSFSGDILVVVGGDFVR